MKTYACDKCGAEFQLEDDDLDDVCPDCFSVETTLLYYDEDIKTPNDANAVDDDSAEDDDFDFGDDYPDDFADDLDDGLDDNLDDEEFF